MCMYMYSYNRTKIVQSSFFFIVFEMKIIKFEINILLIVSTNTGNNRVHIGNGFDKRPICT